MQGFTTYRATTEMLHIPQRFNLKNYKYRYPFFCKRVCKHLLSAVAKGNKSEMYNRIIELHSLYIIIIIHIISTGYNLFPHELYDI